MNLSPVQEHCTMHAQKCARLQNMATLMIHPAAELSLKILKSNKTKQLPSQEITESYSHWRVWNKLLSEQHLFALVVKRVIA